MLSKYPTTLIADSLFVGVSIYTFSSTHTKQVIIAQTRQINTRE